MNEGLRNRLILKLKFVHLGSSLLHVGSGKAEGELLKVVRVRSSEGKQLFIIPSHSIKGVLRRVSELIAKSTSIEKEGLEYSLIRAHCELEGEGVRHICSDDEDLKTINDYINGILSNESLARKYIPPDSLDSIREAFESEGIKGTAELEPIVAHKCPLCNLYGGPGLGGKILVNDIVLEGASTFIISRTSIERASGKVREGALFTVEALNIPEFIITLIVENITPGSIESLILAGTLKWLTNIGVSFGGMKSVGMGHYVLSSSESRGVLINYNEETGNVEEFLERLVNPLRYVDEGVNIEEIIEVLMAR